METSSRNQQIEFEVFPKENKPNYSYLSNIKGDMNNGLAPIHVVFSHQSVMIIFICILISLIASFTLGVEKGKLITKNTIAFQGPQVKTTETAVAPAIALNSEKMQRSTAERSLPAANDLMAEKNAQSNTQAQNQAVSEETENTPVSGFAIQVASVKTEGSAKDLAESLNKKGFASFTKPSGKYIVVLAGNFTNREEAQVKLKELKKTFTDCFIKKI
jgi:cell division septation protein DedD